MKKIVVLGSAGMLGHVVNIYLRETNKYQVIDASYPLKFNEVSNLLDITDKNTLEKFIRTEKPDIIVNCIGILIKGSKENPENVIYINSYFPHQLVRLSNEIGGKVIHISTDCVFSGKKGNYTENDPKDAYDVYGMSKALGEILNDKDLTFRTSIIGPELHLKGEGLFHWFVQQKGIIKGFTNAYWSGVTTIQLAKAIEAAIEQNIIGLYHVASSPKISKYDLICLFKKVFPSVPVNIEPYDEYQVDKSLMSTRKDFEYVVPSYEEMLYEMKEWILKHKNIYGHYEQLM